MIILDPCLKLIGFYKFGVVIFRLLVGESVSASVSQLTDFLKNGSYKVDNFGPKFLTGRGP